jgi:hypothetical protein
VNVLLPTEGVAFSRAVKLSLHPHDLAAIDAARGTSLERADWLRWALRKVLSEQRAWPYGVEHEVEVACPVCQEPAALMVWIFWDCGNPQAGVLARWSAKTDVWFHQPDDNTRNPSCGCTLSEQDVLSACERAVQQFEERLLSGKGRENDNVKG